MRVLGALAAVVRSGLAHKALPVVVAGLAVLLCTPSLRVGLQADDYLIWAALADPPPLPDAAKPAWRLFTGPDEAGLRRAIDTGTLPWWTSPRLRIAFFRPLSGLTHWLDVRLLPRWPWLMHVHSLLWFGAAIAAAAALFRRLLRPEWVAGLAALVFALDDAHGLPAAWLANRNASIGTLFAVLALLAHDRWRQDGWRPGAVIAPLALLLGLLGGEIALAGGAYLLAYALFLDGGTPRQRLVSLLPATLAGLGWAVAYRALGFGVRESGSYTDPLASPLPFLRAVIERGPLLLLGQWALPSHLGLLFSERAARWWWLFACAAALLLAVLLAPLLRRDRTARFFALGMILSLLPACSTIPHDRMLFLASLGGAGLLAQWLAGLAAGAAWLPRARAWRWPAAGAAVVAVVVHLLLAPMGLASACRQVRAFGAITRGALNLPAGPEVREQTLVIAQTPAAFVSLYVPAVLAASGRPIPRRMIVLGPGINAVTFERPREDTLLVRPEGGYLLPPGRPVPGSQVQDFNVLYLLPKADGLFRDARPMHLGERFDLPGISVEVTALTGDGRAAEVRFGFEGGLANPALVWLRWEAWGYVPFEPPAVGASVTLPAPTVRARRF